MAAKMHNKTSLPARSERIHAQPSPDARFEALLRKQCVRAATVGALTAAGELVPGLSRVLGLLFGELLDARFLAGVQRELVEGTFAIYGLDLPAPVQSALVGRVQMLGASASVAGDAVVRQLIRRSAGALGGFVVARVLPLTSIASSAFSNAMVTYAVGKRAQSVAKLRDTPIAALPDALRAFSGVDERRVLDWTVQATRSALGSIGSALRKAATKATSAVPRRKSARKKRAAG
jgi:hypothetical protein